MAEQTKSGNAKSMSGANKNTGANPNMGAAPIIDTEEFNNGLVELYSGLSKALGAISNAAEEINKLGERMNHLCSDVRYGAISPAFTRKRVCGSLPKQTVREAPHTIT